VVSVDGLRADHDRRRTPATYDRILSSISGTPHDSLSVTGQMARNARLRRVPGVLVGAPEVKQIWFSLFTRRRRAA
jgi:hypothetical protein